MSYGSVKLLILGLPLRIWRTHIIFVAVGLVAFSSAYGVFWDQGFENPVVRSDFNSPIKGTSSNPITIDAECLFVPSPDSQGNLAGHYMGNGVVNSCPENKLGMNLAFPNSNWWEENGGGSATNYWTVHFNVEDWWKSNSGPPGQSLPKASPGNGVFGFAPIMNTPIGEDFYRAHMVLRSDLFDPDDNDRPDPHPFMSFGAVADSGNGGTLGMIGHPHFQVTPRVQFVSKLWGATPEAETESWHFVYFWTQWWSPSEQKMIPRMVFVILWGTDNLQSWPCGTGPGCTTMGTRSVWSWPIQESFLYPGADIGFVNVETLASQCPSAVLGYDKMLEWGSGGSEPPRDERTYDFNIDRIFRCMSNAGSFLDPMPTSGVMSIRGIQWGNEAGGAFAQDLDAQLWTSVHGMIMY